MIKIWIKGRYVFNLIISLTDEELGGFKGMKLFVQTPQFQKLNMGFGLDEGMLLHVHSVRDSEYGFILYWIKRVGGFDLNKMHNRRHPLLASVKMWCKIYPTTMLIHSVKPESEHSLLFEVFI